MDMISLMMPLLVMLGFMYSAMTIIKVCEELVLPSILYFSCRGEISCAKSWVMAWSFDLDMSFHISIQCISAFYYFCDYFKHVIDDKNCKYFRYIVIIITKCLQSIIM